MPPSLLEAREDGNLQVGICYMHLVKCKHTAQGLHMIAFLSASAFMLRGEEAQMRDKGDILATTTTVLLAEHDNLELVITRQHTSTSHSAQNVGTSTLEQRLHALVLHHIGKASS